MFYCSCQGKVMCDFWNDLNVNGFDVANYGLLTGFSRNL
jgi:hypothetical protein